MASDWELVMRSLMSSMRFSRFEAVVARRPVVVVMVIPFLSMVCRGGLVLAAGVADVAVVTRPRVRLVARF